LFTCLFCFCLITNPLRHLKPLRDNLITKTVFFFCRSTCSCLLPICQRSLFNLKLKAES